MPRDTYAAALERPRINRLLLPLWRFFPNGRDPAAYCCAGDGVCMEPEIGDGDTVIVSPAAALVPGRPVVIWFRDGRKPLIKRLIASPSSPSHVLRVATINPLRVFEFPMRIVDRVHAIVGNLSPEEAATASALHRRHFSGTEAPPKFMVDRRGVCVHVNN